MNNKDRAPQVIKILDEYIEKHGIKKLTPNQASVILDNTDTLNSFPSCQGLNLRNMLREGLIPHAIYEIKPGNKQGKWYIPHS